MDWNAFWSRGRREMTSLVRDDLVGIDEWRTSWKRALLLPRGLGAGARAIRGHASMMADGVAGAARAAFPLRIRPGRPLATRSADPAVRFEAAREAYGLDEAGLRAETGATHRAFVLYAVCTALVLSASLVTWRHFRTDPTALPDAVWRASPVLAGAMLAFRAAFANWQMRTRRLGSAARFLSRPGEWMTHPDPSVPASGGLAAAALSVALLLAVGGLAVPEAAAEAGTPTTAVTQLFALPDTHDLWYQLLTFVFPGVGPVGGQVTPIAAGIGGGFMAMTTCLMALSAAMIAWQVVGGAVMTAHTGKMLGERWNTVWAPVRVCYGFASLVPVAKGYCIMQVLVLWAALISGQMGNMIWSGFVDGLGAPGASSPPALPQTMPLVRDDFGMELCFAAIEQQARASRRPLAAWPADGVPGATASRLSWGNIVYSMTSFWSSGRNAGQQQPSRVAEYRWNYGRCGWLSASYTTSAGDGGDANVGALDASRRAAFNALRADMRRVAQQIVLAASPGTGKDIVDDMPKTIDDVLEAKNRYDTALANAGQAYASATNKVTNEAFRKAAKAAGWIAAGPYYMTLGRIQGQAYAYVGEQPRVEFQASDTQNPLLDPAFSAMLGTDGASVLQTAVKWWNDKVGTDARLDVSAARAGQFDDTGSVTGALQDHVLSVDGAVWAWVLKLVQIEPGKGTAMQQLIDFGNQLMNLVLLVFGAVLGISVVGKTTVMGVAAKGGMKALSAAFPALSKAVGFAATFAGLIAVSLLMAAVFHALVLPMLPYIHFLFAAMDMLVIVVVAYCAAPIWAFMHIRMDGQEFHDGPQRAGYGMLFNLLFRIPLTLLGLFFSILVFEAMAWLMAQTLMPAMVSATSTSFFGLIGTVTYLIVISVVNYQLATRSFHMITQVPERVVRWFGASGDGGEAEQHSGRTIALAAGRVEQGLGAGASAAKGAFFAGPGQRQEMIGAVKEAMKEQKPTEGSGVKDGKV